MSLKKFAFLFVVFLIGFLAFVCTKNNITVKHSCTFPTGDTIVVQQIGSDFFINIFVQSDSSIDHHLIRVDTLPFPPVPGPGLLNQYEVLQDSILH